MNDVERSRAAAARQVTRAMDRPEAAVERNPSAGDATTVRLGAGMGLLDLAIGASNCGQYLMLTCRGDLVALMGVMGSDVETVELSDGSRYRVQELIDRVAA